MFGVCRQIVTFILFHRDHLKWYGQYSSFKFKSCANLTVIFLVSCCLYKPSKIYTHLGQKLLSSHSVGQRLGFLPSVFDSPVWLLAGSPGHLKYVWVGIHEPYCLHIFPSSVFENRTKPKIPTNPCSSLWWMPACDLTVINDRLI